MSLHKIKTGDALVNPEQQDFHSTYVNQYLKRQYFYRKIIQASVFAQVIEWEDFYMHENCAHSGYADEKFY